MSHHHANHQTNHWNAWRNLILLWTAVFTAIFYRVTHAGMILSVLIGFALAASGVSLAYRAAHRRHR